MPAFIERCNRINSAARKKGMTGLGLGLAIFTRILKSRRAVLTIDS